MKAHDSQLLRIEEIVDQTLLDLGEGMHRKEQFLSWGVKIFKKWRKDMAREYKIVRLTMTPWKAITLPTDCVDVICVGVQNGQSFDLFVPKKMMPKFCACDDAEPTEAEYEPEEGSEGIQFNAITEFGEDPGKMYGLISKDNGLGYYSINHNEGSNEIQLSSNVPSTTRPVLYYLATLFNPDKDCCVHPYAQDMMENFIHWKNLQMKRRAGAKNISGDMVAEAKKEFDDEWCALAEARLEITADSIVELVRDSYSLTPKN